MASHRRSVYRASRKHSRKHSRRHSRHFGGAAPKVKTSLAGRAKRSFQKSYNKWCTGLDAGNKIIDGKILVAKDQKKGARLLKLKRSLRRAGSFACKKATIDPKALSTKQVQEMITVAKTLQTAAKRDGIDKDVGQTMTKAATNIKTMLPREKLTATQRWRGI